MRSVSHGTKELCRMQRLHNAIHRSFVSCRMRNVVCRASQVEKVHVCLVRTQTNGDKRHVNTNSGTFGGMIHDKTSDDVGLGNNDNVNIEENG
ncbi:uncharacterized protein HKW66_Vig0143150 [Vigna angularis]|uniref:Uncharacterized protein n=1 Tax=Phaseolus angularis TaxID=3914 RepID=A0A8T0KE05_PHAAN|nr:uncharacterized protein HKW66_Vig0143150 [Vigna angularis]